MKGIRPLERGDVPEVASLYELTMRSGSRTPPPGLAPYLERLLLDHPWFDPELPSLVYRQDEGSLVGFLGSHARRLRLGDRTVRLACSGQLIADPEARTPGVGALLLTRYLRGPQQLTLTDGATETVRRIWERLGGETAYPSSIAWVRLFRPFNFASDVIASRRGRSARRPARPLWSALDGVARRVPRAGLRPRSSELTAEKLTPAALLEHLDAVSGRNGLRPDYDRTFLEWLFAELAEVRSRGRLVSTLLRSEGEAAGWYLYYLQPRGVCHVLQVAATEHRTGDVLDHLFHHAAAGGAAALSGRLEPRLVESIARRRCILRYNGAALIHSRERELLAAALSHEALLTRLEGEWWMAPHTEDLTEPASAVAR